jgi:phosphinothricin acetyltransferase
MAEEIRVRDEASRVASEPSSLTRDAGATSIVPLEPQYWDRVRAIYLDGLATGQASFETTPPEWTEWDQAHLPHPRLAALRRGEIIGWVALCPVSKRRCYSGVAEVSIYIDSEARGQGVGRLLLEEVIRVSERAGIWTLQAVIFPENIGSIRLHERCGFRLVGRRERIAQRDRVWRDTLLLERRSWMTGV